MESNPANGEETKWPRYRDDGLLLVVLLSQPLGHQLDHDVGLQPVVQPGRLLLLVLLPLLLFHLNKK